MTATAPAPAAASNRDADPWFTPGRFTLLLTAIIVARYPKVVTGQETFFYRDYGLFTYPIAHYFRQCFWRGELPLWNPLNNCGVPLLAQWNTAILYPPALFYLILPLTWSLAIFNLGHLVLAGTGMYFLARRWTGNSLAGSVAGMAFALNGLSLHMIMWISNLAAWAWMPWVVLAVERAWREGGRRLAPAILASAVQMLAGAPELILLTWGFLAVMWLAQIWRGESPRGRMTTRIILICALTGGLAAAQLLPFAELLKHSQRDASYGDSRWAMPGWGWANFLVPLFHCSPSIIGIFSQDEQQWTSSYYMGVGVLALGLLALWRGRSARVWWLAVAVIAGVVLSMGENAHVYGWLKTAMPLLGVMRYPIKIVVLTVFALPLLAAFAFQDGRDIAPRCPRPRQRGRNDLSEALSEPSLAPLIPARTAQRAVPAKDRSGFLGVGIFLLALMAAVLAYARRNPLPDETWLVTRESGVTRAVFLILILGAAWMAIQARLARTRHLAGLALLLLIALDALTHTANQNPSITAAAFGPLGIEDAVRARLGESRALTDPKLQAFLLHAATPDALKYFIGTRRALYLNCNLFDGIPTAGGFFSLELRSPARVEALLNGVGWPFPEPLADFVGASQISSPDTSFTWLARTNYMPLVTAGQKPIFADGDDTLKAVASSNFDPRTTVYLAKAAKDFISATNLSKAQIIQSKMSAQKVELTVQAEAPAMVVVARTFYNPWHAYVDGRQVALWEANGAFQALEVPAGRNEVRLIYEDRMFEAGSAISIASLALLGVVWFRNRRA